MTPNEQFDALFKYFLVLQDQRDQLIAIATSGAQAKLILDAWREANAMQLLMGNLILINNTQRVHDLTAALRKTTSALEQQVAALKGPGETIEKFNTVLATIAKAMGLSEDLVEAAQTKPATA